MLLNFFIYFFYYWAGAINPMAHNTIINVKDYGAKGDGISNDYPALKNIFAMVSSKGSGEIYFPPGTYYIDNYHSQLGKTQDLTISNCSYLKIHGKDAVISVNGKFHRPATRTSGKGNTYSSTYAVTPIIIRNSKNVIVENLEIRGNVQLTTKENKVAETGGRLLFVGECEGVTLNNLYLHHAQMDGLYIKGAKNLVATNIVSSNNARQGMTIVELDGGKFINCKFINTGVTNGNYGKHGPSAGVDIEPNTKVQYVKNVSFFKCEFTDNLGAQILISNPVTTQNITFDSCHIEANENSAPRTIIVNAQNVVFQNSTIICENGSIYPVWHKQYASSTFRNCIIKSNRSAFVAVENDLTKKVAIENCIIEYTGKKRLNTYFPYLKMTNLTFTNNQISIPSIYYREKGPSVMIEKAMKVSGNTFLSEGRVNAPPASFSGSNTNK